MRFFLICSALFNLTPLVLKTSLLSVCLIADVTTRGPQLQLSSCCGYSCHRKREKTNVVSMRVELMTFALLVRRSNQLS
ncbi:hypothetical protein GGR51DRAFT_533240, partial [Nemania sp. FL0031]